MSEKYKQRSIIEIMNDVLSTIRDYYDSEYVYYIEKKRMISLQSMNGVQRMFRGRETVSRCWMLIRCPGG